jgi:ABC-type spermidine/putrescine transport system permease subunit II
VSTVAERPAAMTPERTSARPPKDFDRPRFLRVFAWIFYLFMFAPIALVVLFSFNSSRSLQNFEGFSFRWY